MIRPFTLLTVILAASSGAYLFAVKHRAQVLDDQLAAVAQQSRLDGQRIRVLQAQWALEIDPTRLSQLASQFTTLQPVKPDQLVTMAALRQVLPPPGVGAPEPNPEEPMPVDLANPAAGASPPGPGVYSTPDYTTIVAANGLPLPPQMPPEQAPRTVPVATALMAAAMPGNPSFTPPLVRPSPHRTHAPATRIAQNVAPPAFAASRGYELPGAPPTPPMAPQFVSVRAPAAAGPAMATSNPASGGSMLGMAQDALAPPQPIGTDN